MEEVQQQNKFTIIKEYFKNNKYNVYFTVAIGFLLIMIVALIAVIATRSNTNRPTQVTQIEPTSSSVSVSPSYATISQEPSAAQLPIMTPAPAQASLIENQVQPQIQQRVTGSYTVTNITQYGDNWGTMNISNTDAGGAGVVIQKVNNTWTVVAGPGSLFPPDLLQSVGAPQELIDNFTVSGPSSSPSPSQ